MKFGKSATNFDSPHAESCPNGRRNCLHYFRTACTTALIGRKKVYYFHVSENISTATRESQNWYLQISQGHLSPTLGHSQWKVVRKARVSFTPATYSLQRKPSVPVLTARCLCSPSWTSSTADRNHESQLPSPIVPNDNYQFLFWPPGVSVHHHEQVQRSAETNGTMSLNFRYPSPIMSTTPTTVTYSSQRQLSVPVLTARCLCSPSWTSSMAARRKSTKPTRRRLSSGSNWRGCRPTSSCASSASLRTPSSSRRTPPSSTSPSRWWRHWFLLSKGKNT